MLTRYGQATGKWGELRRLYRDNLKAVLETIYVHRGEFPGRTIITSDHGELIGEGGWYWHPPRERSAFARVQHRVPWMELKK